MAAVTGGEWVRAGALKRVYSWDLWPDLGVRPRVVLALPWRDVHAEWLLDPARAWHRVEHQSGGLACHHPHWLLTELTPRRQVTGALLELHARYDGSNLGTFAAVSVDDLVGYRRALRSLLGVDCNHGWPALEEAVYPVDPTPAFVTKLVTDTLPENRQALITLPEGASRMARVQSVVDRWQLLIVTENSD